MQNIGGSAPMDLMYNSSSPDKDLKKRGSGSSDLEKKDPLSPQSFSEQMRKKSKKESAESERKTADRSSVDEKGFNQRKSVQENAFFATPQEESEAATVEDDQPEFFHNEIDQYDLEINFEQAKKKEAMAKFMDSMESELGVSSESIVQAMKNLSSAEGQLPPERTMAKVLSNLNLEGGDVDKAADIYGRFLKNMSRGDLNLDSSTVKNEISSANLAMLSPSEQRRIRHSNSIDKVNAGFFSGAGAAKAALMKEVDNRTQQDLSMSKIMNQFNDVGRTSPSQVSNDYQQYSKGGIDMLTRQMTPVNQFSSENLQMAQQLKNAMGNSQPASESSTNFFGANSSGGGMLNVDLSSAGADLGAQGDSGFSAFQGESNGNEFFNSAENAEVEGLESMLQGQSTTGANKAKAMTSLQAMIANSLEGEAPEVSNMNDIVDQAQVMVQKGGGKVKMLLNPEGLGQVDLKVDVKDGQVNIQMLTEHPQAKKALEAGLMDLKDSLAIQKLNVDSVKIDVSTELAKNFEEQQGEAEKDFAREFARDFMGGRRDQSQFSRGGLMDSPFQKYFLQDRAEVDPLEMQGVNPASTKKNPNGRLNLVA